MSMRRSNSSEALVKFLKERVESNQGISLHKLTGHLSQMPPDLRNKYGCSVKSLRGFLEQFPEVFFISHKSDVYVRTKIRQTASPLSGIVENFIPSTSYRGADVEEVTCLSDVRGTVYRVFSVYGFISIHDPLKTSVYFDVRSFENGEHISLISSGLQVGDCVVFDAQLGPKNCEARFRATRVTRPSITKISASPGLSINSVTGADFGTITHLVKQRGVIETLKSNYGFIKFGHCQRERAFFHTNDLVASLSKSIKDLQDVFSVADKVHFNAQPSNKPSDRAKWHATTVYLCRSRCGNRAAVPEDDTSDDIFMSDNESDTQYFPPTKANESDSSGSLASPLAAPPAVTGTSTNRRSPGAYTEVSAACESAPDVSFLSASVNGDVLLRLSKMVASEIMAEKKRLRVGLKDVAVETIDEDPLSST